MSAISLHYNIIREVCLKTNTVTIFFEVNKLHSVNLLIIIPYKKYTVLKYINTLINILEDSLQPKIQIPLNNDQGHK